MAVYISIRERSEGSIGIYPLSALGRLSCSKSEIYAIVNGYTHSLIDDCTQEVALHVVKSVLGEIDTAVYTSRGTPLTVIIDLNREAERWWRSFKEGARS